MASHTDVDEQTSAASDVQWYIKPHKKNRARSVYKKWSFALRISSVNVTKSAVSCGFGQIYWKNPWWKTSLFVQWLCSTHQNQLSYLIVLPCWVSSTSLPSFISDSMLRVINGNFKNGISKQTYDSWNLSEIQKLEV